MIITKEKNKKEEELRKEKGKRNYFFFVALFNKSFMLIDFEPELVDKLGLLENDKVESEVKVEVFGGGTIDVLRD